MITINLEEGWVARRAGGRETKHALATPEAFEIVSEAWIRAGWDAKYVYSFTWLGRPVIQLPDDLLRIQELLFAVKPDVIVETGVAHGGSLVFYATLCKAMERGRVIGVDIEIRPPNREALERHFLRPYFELVEGSSIAPDTVARVRERVRPGETVMVCLDACHLRDHVLGELRAYAPLVTPGSYVVVMDGLMARLGNAPRTKPDWAWNNPLSAIDLFLAEQDDFEAVEPGFPFNEGICRSRVTYWPRAFLRRRMRGAS